MKEFCTPARKGTFTLIVLACLLNRPVALSAQQNAGPLPVAEIQGTWNQVGNAGNNPPLLVIDQAATGYAARYVPVNTQSIAGLQGSPTDREIAYRNLPVWVISGTDPSQLTMVNGRYTEQLKLIDSTHLEITLVVNETPPRTVVYQFTRKDGAPTVQSNGELTFNHSALSFSGHPGLKLPSGSVDFSLSVNAAAGPLFGTDVGYHFYLNYDSKGFAALGEHIPFSIQPHQWYHVALSSNGFQTQLAVDGKIQGTFHNGMDMGQSEHIVFGFNGNSYFDGAMRNPRIWDAAIPIDELALMGDETAAPDELKPYLLVENGKLLTDATTWEKQTGAVFAQPVYIVSAETVLSGTAGDASPHRAALSLSWFTKRAASYEGEDEFGWKSQMFNLVPTSDGYFKFLNLDSLLPVTVADATAAFTGASQVVWVTTNTADRVYTVQTTDRHLEQGTSAANVTPTQQFRFLRQVILRNDQFVLEWYIQSRAAAESVMGTMPQYNGQAIGRVPATYGGQIVQLADAKLGTPFVHVRYQPGNQNQQLFTVFPAHPEYSRPDPFVKAGQGDAPFIRIPITLANFGNKSVRQTLVARQTSYKNLTTKSSLVNLPPVPNDATGKETTLFNDFNNRFAALAVAGSTMKGSFEDNYVRPVLVSLPNGLDTATLRGTTEARFATYRTNCAADKSASVAELDQLWQTINNLLNYRSSLGQLVTDLKTEIQTVFTDDTSIQSELARRFEYQPVDDISTGGPQSPLAIINMDTADNLFSDASSFASDIGDLGTELTQGFGWITLGFQALSLVENLLDFSLSQLTTAQTLTAYSDGSDKVDLVRRALFLSVDVARKKQLAVTDDLATLAVYDPNLMQEIGLSVSDNETYLKTQMTGLAKGREDRLTKEAMRWLLPAYGAVMGVERINVGFANWTPAQDPVGYHSLDRVYNDLNGYYNAMANDGTALRTACFAQGANQGNVLANQQTILATTIGFANDDNNKPLPGSPFIYTWHLVRRPASAQFREFSSALLDDVHKAFPDPLELMQVMSNSTYVHARLYRLPCQGVAGQNLRCWAPEIYSMNDAECPSGGGDGVWMPVPGGMFNRSGQSFGTPYFLSLNTGRDVSRDQFVRPAAAQTLFYWPSGRSPLAGSNLIQGFELPIPANWPAPPSSSNSETATRQ